LNINKILYKRNVIIWNGYYKGQQYYQ